VLSRSPLLLLSLSLSLSLYTIDDFVPEITKGSITRGAFAFVVEFVLQAGVTPLRPQIQSQAQEKTGKLSKSKYGHTGFSAVERLLRYSMQHYAWRYVLYENQL